MARTQEDAIAVALRLRRGRRGRRHPAGETRQTLAVRALDTRQGSRDVDHWQSLSHGPRPWTGAGRHQCDAGAALYASRV